jgi:hypothetical protein
MVNEILYLKSKDKSLNFQIRYLSQIPNYHQHSPKDIFWKESLLKRVFISTKLAENKPCLKHNQIKNG